MFKLPSSWPPARVERRVRAAVDDTVSGDSADAADSADAGDEFQMALSYCVYRCLVILWRSGAMIVRCFRDVSHETIGFETTFGHIMAFSISNKMCF